MQVSIQKNFFIFIIFITCIFSPLPLHSLYIEAIQTERLTYELKWGVIPAGLAKIEVKKDSDRNYSLHLSAMTHPYIDSIYPVRLFIKSTFKENLKALRYFKDTKEGFGKKKKEEIIFSEKDGTASYFKNGRLKRTFSVPSQILDPLSSLFACREYDVVSRSLKMKITDGKKIVDGDVAFLRREEISTPAGTFRAMALQPNFKGLGGIFKDDPTARITLWITDDSRRIPIRLSSDFKVGSFSAEITSIE
jgi:hypothetical protein